jgi:hypothetical protein
MTFFRKSKIQRTNKNSLIEYSIWSHQNPVRAGGIEPPGVYPQRIFVPLGLSLPSRFSPTASGPIKDSLRPGRRSVSRSKAAAGRDCLPRFRCEIRHPKNPLKRQSFPCGLGDDEVDVDSSLSEAMNAVSTTIDEPRHGLQDTIRSPR